MEKPIKKRNNRRFRNMIILTSMSAILLVVSTYAWFIGTQTVKVSPFDVEIAAIDGLALSLNGVDFSTTVNINSENFDDTVNTVYAGNTNTWGQGGLTPVSSVGDIDTAVSRLKLYEKSSLTSNPGGYRLMASRIPNTAANEHRGYVAFDLFVKNLSGTDYIEDFDIANEEAIYLTTDSEVKTALGGVQNTGIENSVRVAFAQIGRVKSDASAGLVQGISCTEAEGVVPICTRPATIWEPNDTRHVQGAIDYYDESCQGRTVEDNVDSFAGAGTCTAVADLGYTTTYAIQSEITSPTAVNVYDGLNGYTATIGTRGEAGKPLMAVTSFTDTDKNKVGVERPEFIKLAANSITKVRIYIYLEGQDVDNYDYASVGKKISVNFGFTKQRFTEGEIIDIGENGTTIAPLFTVPVTSNPLVIAEADAAEFNVKKAVTLQYAELSAGKYVISNEGYLLGEDPEDPTRADLNDNVTIQMDGAAYDVGDLTVGEHRISYQFTDDRGYAASTTITVIVTE